MRAPECQASISRTAGKQPVSKKRSITVNESDWSVSIQGVSLGTVVRILDRTTELDDYSQEPRFVKVEWMSDDESTIDLAVDRSLVALNVGLKAAVPNDVKIGDEVVIFIGARTPFVLRRREHSNDTSMAYYQLLGDCYVYDDVIMRGDTLSGIDASRFTDFHMV